MSFSLSLTVADRAFPYDTLSVARSDTLAAVAGKPKNRLNTHLGGVCALSAVVVTVMVRLASEI